MSEPVQLAWKSEPTIRRFKPEEKKPIQTVTLSALPPDWEDPSIWTKAKRLRRELTLWGKAGLKLVSKEVRKARLEVCHACEYYDTAGNLGLGQCRAPGCGCTSVKAALNGMKCPKGKWPA